MIGFLVTNFEVIVVFQLTLIIVSLWSLFAWLERKWGR